MSGYGATSMVFEEGTNCRRDTHVDGCPCAAGGDAELRLEYVSFPMCLMCGEEPGTLSVDVMADGEPEPFAGICADCYEECE